MVLFPTYKANAPPGGVWKPGFPKVFGPPSLRGKWEIWPLMGFVGVWAAMATYTVFWAMKKPEVQINRHKKTRPLDWERAKTEAVGHHWYLYNPNPTVDRPGKIPELEAIEEELAKVAHIHK